MASLGTLQHCQEILESFLMTESSHSIQEAFRIVIEYCRKNKKNDDTLLGKLCVQLLTILTRNNLPIDTQMLCSIAFCVSLIAFNTAKKSLEVFQYCLSISRDSANLKISINDEDVNVAVKCSDSFRLCLCHGMLQSRSKLILDCECRHEQIPEEIPDPEKEARLALAYNMLTVVLECCKKYSRLTYLAFRVLTTWLMKMGHTPVTADHDVYNKIFPVVCTNWDNPMNGVRDQNARLLDLLFDLHGCQLKSLLTNTLHHQPWTVKSKYFVLATLLPKYGISKAFEEFPDLAPGLLWSLSQCHLVSAGCEAYRACILDISEAEWSLYFLQHHLKVMQNQDANDSVEMDNLFNYWMPYTLQRFPTIANLLMSNLSPEPSVPLLFLLKLSQLYADLNEPIKALVVDEPITPLRILTDSIRHSNEAIRQLSLAIVCTSVKTTVTPSVEEFQFVKDFLTENVSGDSAPFRQNIHNSFSGFMKRFHHASLHEAKKKTSRRAEQIICNKKTDDDNDSVLHTEETLDTPRNCQNYGLNSKPSHTLNLSDHILDPIERVSEFLTWLHLFIISNLEPGTNYQRKVLSLRLYHLLLSTWHNDSHVIPANSSFTSKLSRHALLTCILSPTEDIREIAGDLLLKYFSDLTFEENLTLLERSLELCRSPMFYQAEGGALLLKIVTAWIYKNDAFALLASKYSPLASHSSLSRMLLMEARQQWSAMQDSLFKAVSCGSPVHGVITALARIATDEDGPEYARIGADCTAEVIALMEELVEHLLSALAGRTDKATEFAPSFAEMGKAIESATHQEAAHVQLTAAHQLLLNCVWLNFKACCLLSSGLARKPGTDLATVRRCAQLAVQVLTRCRHKGAIESAGTSLGRLVRSLPAEQQVISGEMLEEFLDSHTGGASVTRRSAGLAILVHRIVANDQQLSRPLVLLAVNRLIALASTPVDSTEAELSDLPQAQALHFLRTLLQDSALRQYVAPSISDVAILCFKSLTSPMWTVRNAALQLFGAVVSKLVGQKKPQEEDIVATAEELTSHFPELFNYLLCRLHQALATPSLHASLVPALSLLAKMTVKHPQLHDPTDIFSRLHSCFLPLSSSHVHAVRKLAAKAFASFTPFPLVYKTISILIEQLLGNKKLTENSVNGGLLTVTYLVERFKYESANMTKYSTDGKNVNLDLSQLCQLREISYFNRALVSQLISSTASLNLEYCKEICCLFESTISTDYSPCCSIGIHQWANVELESIVRLCSNEELFPCLKRIAMREGGITETIKDAAMQRLHQDSFPSAIKSSIVKSLFELLCVADYVCNAQFFMQVLLAILFNNCDSVSFDLQNLKMFYKSNVESAGRGSKCCSQGMIVICILTRNLVRVANFCINEYFLQLFNELVGFIASQCSSISCDEDDRTRAADGLSFLAEPLLKIIESDLEMKQQVRKICLTSAVAMLQDENCEVRSLSTRFAWTIVSNLDYCNTKCLFKDSREAQSLKNVMYNPHPYYCLQTLLSPQHLTILLGANAAMDFLWHQLDYASELERLEKAIGVSQVSSPFEHGKNNIYAEEVKVVEWAAVYLLDMLQAADDDTRQSFVAVASERRAEYLKDAELILELASKNVGDQADVYLVAKQLYYQHELLDSFLKAKDCSWIIPLVHFVQNLGLVS